MCYLDKTFCTCGVICKNGYNCPNVLTPKVIEDAQKWWGENNGSPPIAVYDSLPNCFVPFFSIE